MRIRGALSSCLVAGLFAMCLFGSNISANAAELQITLMKAKPAVAHILVRVYGQVATDSGQKLWPQNSEFGMVKGGWGSGFFINPNGYLVTNGHVVADAHESNDDIMRLITFQMYLEQIEIPKYEQKNKVKLSDADKVNVLKDLYQKYKDSLRISLKKDIQVILSNKKVYSAEVKEYSPAVTPMSGGGTGSMSTQVLGVNKTMRTGKDVSILKIEDRNFPTVRLGDSANVQIGETIHAIGYPAAAESSVLSEESKLLEQSITTGHISGGKIDIKGTPMIQTDANISWGNSGGPCINGQGEVVGIVSYIGLANNQAFAGFNWLVPINTAKEFIAAAGIDTNERSLFDKDWEAALRLFSEGKYDEAETALKNVLVYMPEQPDALKLLLRLKEITANQPPKEAAKGNNVVLIAVVAGAVVLLLLIGIIAFSKKKKAPAAAAPPSQPAYKPTAVSTAPKPAGYGVLIGRTAPFKDKTFQIGAAGLKIGRDPAKNDIAVDHDEASREHAWIGPEEGKIVVKDLNSTNGTFVNSVSSGQIKKALLNPGDIVIIGKGGYISLIHQRG